MQTLELTQKNLRKGVDPEGRIGLTDLNYESFQEARTAYKIVYTSPTGKAQTLKDREGGRIEETV